MALLVATSIINNTAGNKAQVLVQLPAASNGDTWDAKIAGIRTVDFATTTHNDAAAVAADSNSATWATSIVTFNVAGTARAQALIVWGKTHPVA